MVRYLEIRAPPKEVLTIHCPHPLNRWMVKMYSHGMRLPLPMPNAHRETRLTIRMNKRPETALESHEMLQVLTFASDVPSADASAEIGHVITRTSTARVMFECVLGTHFKVLAAKDYASLTTIDHGRSRTPNLPFSEDPARDAQSRGQQHPNSSDRPAVTGLAAFACPPKHHKCRVCGANNRT